MRAWLRGGIIGLIVYLVLILITVPLGSESVIGVFLTYSVFFPLFVINVFLCKTFSCVAVVSIFSSVIIGFLIGAIIGWIVEKIRGKK